MEKKSARELILEQLKEKSCMKQDVYQRTAHFFELLKEILAEIAEELKVEIGEEGNRIEIEYTSRGKYEAELKFAGDVLLFHMHSNVFNFDKSHRLYKTSYVKEDESRAYCGIINVYNFLADSIKYNRFNDSGYLVARLFVNKDDHFFVEGKRQLGFLYNDFINSTLDRKILKDILQSTILYTLDFDLLTPPYDQMKEITVHEVHELTNEMKIKTGKRLGFRFESDS
ncbi:MAG: hypothetical protein JKY53_09825 [Flavobacteriales bacterium]|nr:hypothetical protein [Flavobacteriales bacterium]